MGFARTCCCSHEAETVGAGTEKGQTLQMHRGLHRLNPDMLLSKRKTCFTTSELMQKKFLSLKECSALLLGALSKFWDTTANRDQLLGFGDVDSFLSVSRD